MSKIFWLMIRPERVAFGFLCVGIVLLFTRRWRTGRALLAGLLGVSVALGTVPVGDWLLHRLEIRFPPPDKLPGHVDGIIMLGGDLDIARTVEAGRPVGRTERLLAFAELSQRYPDAKLVFTGGSGALIPGGTSEAEAMPIALHAVNVDTNRVLLEGVSRNTHENAVFTRELAKPKPGDIWLLITSAAHMPRAVGCFRGSGFPVVPYPVEYRVIDGYDWMFYFSFDGGFMGLTPAVKEILGLLSYRLLGYTDALFPAP